MKAASVAELESELQKQFMLGTTPIMVVKHGQTARLADLADLPAKAKIQIQKAGGPVRVTSMASVVSTSRGVMALPFMSWRYPSDCQPP